MGGLLGQTWPGLWGEGWWFTKDPLGNLTKWAGAQGQKNAVENLTGLQWGPLWVAPDWGSCRVVLMWSFWAPASQ